MNKPLIFLAGVAAAAVVGYILSDDKKENEPKGYSEVKLDEEGNPIVEETETENGVEEHETKIDKIKKHLNKETLKEDFVKAVTWGVNHTSEIELASVVIGLLTSLFGLRNVIKDGKKWESGGKLNWFDYVKANAGKKSMLVSDVDNGVFIVEYKEAV